LKKSEKKMLALAVILVALGGLWVGNVFAPLGLVSPLKWTPTPPVPPTGWEGGTFDMKAKGFDHFDPAVTYPSGNWTVYWYVQRGGAWASLGSGNATIELVKGDAGYVYALCKVSGAVTGTTHNNFIDWSKTVSMNSRIVPPAQYDDFDNDGSKEYMFKVNMQDVPKPASGNPSVTFYLYLIQEGYVSFGTCADITNIGTTTVTKYIQWYVTFTGTKTGVMLRSVKFYFNSTSTTILTFKRLNIPGIGYLGESSFTYNQLGAATTTDGQNWEYICGNTLFTAQPILYPVNTLNRFDFTAEVECTFTAGTHYNVRLELTFLDPAGHLLVITDDVLLSA